MRRWTFAVAALVLGVALIAQTSAAGSSGGETVLKFDTMVGVDAPFSGQPENAIRGIPGAGAPWRLDSVEGKLNSDGRLKIEVEGLVLVRTGLNPQAAFRGAVSCLTTDGTTVSTVNRVTEQFPATIPAGDSEINAKVSLPSPCVAPIVFVMNAGGTSWFAVTGA
ncbi:MAG: hypothetical protein ACRDNP_12415 [Gaiellaceae bacterium]